MIQRSSICAEEEIKEGKVETMNDKETVKSRRNLMVENAANPSGNHLVSAMNLFKANG